MALAINSQMTSNAGVSGSNVSSLSFSFTNTAGTLLVVGVCQSSRTLNSVTYGGAAVTIDASATTGNALSSIGHKLTPLTGAQTVAITFSGGCNCEAGAISFTGINTTTPILQAINAGSGNNTAPTSTITGVRGSSIVVDTTWAGQQYGADSAGTTRTWLKNNTNGSNGESSYAVNTGGSGATITLNKSLTTSGNWCSAAIEIQDPSYVPPPSRFLSLLGCGI